MTTSFLSGDVQGAVFASGGLAFAPVNHASVLRGIPSSHEGAGSGRSQVSAATSRRWHSKARKNQSSR
jgi:hypothetical protein